MELTQNQIERLSDLLQRGEITASQANVEKIKMQRVHLVTCRLSADVRKALNEAVKKGELGHVKKTDGKPEAYFHPTFEYLVAGERNAYVRKSVASLSKVCC